MITRYRAPEAPRPGIALTLSLLALALMFADARLGLLAPVRKTLGAGLYPVQAALAWPGEQLRSIDGYFDDIAALRTENQLLRTVLTQQAGILATTERLRQQNQSLRDWGRGRQWCVAGHGAVGFLRTCSTGSTHSTDRRTSTTRAR